jgi:hypothetical protein
MKFPRRKFLYLAASAATLPALSMGGTAQSPSRPMGVDPQDGARGPGRYRRGHAPAMRDLAAERSDWLAMIKPDIKGE